MVRAFGSRDPLFASEFAPILLCIRVEGGRKGKKGKRKVCSRARDLANGMETREIRRAGSLFPNGLYADTMFFDGTARARTESI